MGPPRVGWLGGSAARFFQLAAYGNDRRGVVQAHDARPPDWLDRPSVKDVTNSADRDAEEPSQVAAGEKRCRRHSGGSIATSGLPNGCLGWQLIGNYSATLPTSFVR